jgi:hypothetical protein
MGDNVPVTDEITFGDRVRVRSTSATDAAGVAGRAGQCYGFSTPSLTKINVVGDLQGDLAYNVAFDDGDDAWFDPRDLELLDHGGGTEITVGDKRLVRDESGEWRET